MESRIRKAKRQAGDQIRRNDSLIFNRFEMSLTLIEALNINRAVDDACSPASHRSRGTSGSRTRTRWRASSVCAASSRRCARARSSRGAIDSAAIRHMLNWIEERPHAYRLMLFLTSSASRSSTNAALSPKPPCYPAMATKPNCFFALSFPAGSHQTWIGNMPQISRKTRIPNPWQSQ